MVPGECLPFEIIKQSNALKHRTKVSGDVCYTHTSKGLLLFCLPHHSMHGDVIYDINPVHPTPPRVVNVWWSAWLFCCHSLCSICWLLRTFLKRQRWCPWLAGTEWFEVANVIISHNQVDFGVKKIQKFFEVKSERSVSVQFVIGES